MEKGGEVSTRRRHRKNASPIRPTGGVKAVEGLLDEDMSAVDAAPDEPAVCHAQKERGCDCVSKRAVLGWVVVA